MANIERSIIQQKGSFNLDKSLRKFKKEKSELPIVIGETALNHFLKGFRQGGGQTDFGFWQPRKKDPKGKKRGILIGKGGGTLWRSIKVSHASFGGIIISTNSPYAKIHNEGLKGLAFGKHTFKMKKREFLGDSKSLDTKLKRLITKEINEVFPRDAI